MPDRLYGVAVGVAGISFLLGVLAGTARDPHPTCFEDEAIVWSSQANDHTICLPVDDIWLAVPVH